MAKQRTHHYLRPQPDFNHGIGINPRKRDEASWLGLISEIWEPFGLAPGHGDDAVVLPPAQYAVSTDFLAEGVDFEREWGPPDALGCKALAVNLSDIASSGAKPAWFFLTLALPEDLEESYVERLLRGMRDRSLREEVRLAGGDLSASRSGLCVSITVLGVQEGRPLRRDGGKPGDSLFVSGPLGGPRAALARFKNGERLEFFDVDKAPEGPQKLLDRFFRPPSQTALGLFLSKEIAVGACMDVSDGLGRDLGRICEASGCGAEIEASAVPPEKWEGGWASLDDAVAGGEEQVLLFSAPQSQKHLLETAPMPLFEIGRLASGRGVTLLKDGQRMAVSGVGFDHFAACGPNETST